MSGILLPPPRTWAEEITAGLREGRIVNNQTALAMMELALAGSPGPRSRGQAADKFARLFPPWAPTCFRSVNSRARAARRVPPVLRAATGMVAVPSQARLSVPPAATDPK